MQCFRDAGWAGPVWLMEGEDSQNSQASAAGGGAGWIGTRWGGGEGGAGQQGIEVEVEWGTGMH